MPDPLNSEAERERRRLRDLCDDLERYRHAAHSEKGGGTVSITDLLLLDLVEQVAGTREALERIVDHLDAAADAAEEIGSGNEDDLFAKD